MKKYIVIIPLLLSLLTIFCGNKQPNVTVSPAPTTDLWNAASATDFITGNILNSAVAYGHFTAVSTIPATNDFITKDYAPYYVCINQSNSYYTALPYGTSFVTKQSLTSSGTILSNSGTLYYVYNDGWGATGGWTSSSAACTHSGAATASIRWSGTFGNGTHIYADPCAQQSVNWINGGGGDNFFYIGGYWFNLSSSGIVSNYTVCSGSLTNVYLHASGTIGSGSITVTVNSYSDAGNSSSINIANASGGNISVGVYFEDAYGNGWTVNGTINNGSNSCTITSGLSGSAYPPILFYCTGTATTSTTQNYIAN